MFFSVLASPFDITKCNVIYMTLRSVHTAAVRNAGAASPRSYKSVLLYTPFYQISSLLPSVMCDSFSKCLHNTFYVVTNMFLIFSFTSPIPVIFLSSSFIFWRCSFIWWPWWTWRWVSSLPGGGGGGGGASGRASPQQWRHGAPGRLGWYPPRVSPGPPPPLQQNTLGWKYYLPSQLVPGPAGSVEGECVTPTLYQRRETTEGARKRIRRLQLYECSCGNDCITTAVLGNGSYLS